MHVASVAMYRRARITIGENMQPSPHGEYSLLAIRSQPNVVNSVASVPILPAFPTQSYDRLRLGGSQTWIGFIFRSA